MQIAIVGEHLQYTHIHLEVQGSLLAIAQKFERVAPAPIIGTRGTIKEFSQASRLRMMRKVARLEVENCTFLTLTYPARYPPPCEAKNNLRAFLERIRRRFPLSSAIWRLEFQRRGASHFHLLVFNMPYVPHEDIQRWWAEIVSEYVDDWLPRVNLRYVSGKDGVMRYVAKYAAKLQASFGSYFSNGSYLHAVTGELSKLGRVWGVFNRDHLPYAQRFYHVLEVVTGLSVKRCKLLMSQAWPELPTDTPQGACVFAERAYWLYFAMLDELLKDMTC